MSDPRGQSMVRFNIGNPTRFRRIAEIFFNVMLDFLVGGHNKPLVFVIGQENNDRLNASVWFTHR